MSPSVNQFCNDHIILSILIAVLIAFGFYTVLYIWQRMSEYCGILYTKGWRQFVRKWETWGIIKRLLFIIMYITTMLGWLIVGLFLIAVSILVAVTAVNYLSKRSNI